MLAQNRVAQSDVSIELFTRELDPLENALSVDAVDRPDGVLADDVASDIGEAPFGVLAVVGEACAFSSSHRSRCRPRRSCCWRSWRRTRKTRRRKRSWRKRKRRSHSPSSLERDLHRWEKRDTCQRKEWHTVSPGDLLGSLLIFNHSRSAFFFAFLFLNTHSNLSRLSSIRASSPRKG